MLKQNVSTLKISLQIIHDDMYIYIFLNEYQKKYGHNKIKALESHGNSHCLTTCRFNNTDALQLSLNATGTANMRRAY